MITRFDHIGLSVCGKMDTIIDFYTGVLGFRLLRRMRMGPEDNQRDLAYIGIGDVLIELLENGEPSNNHFALTVTNVDEERAKLQAAGVQDIRDLTTPRTFWGRQISFNDPVGNRIELREWRDPDGPYFEGWQPTTGDTVRTG